MGVISGQIVEGVKIGVDSWIEQVLPAAPLFQRGEQFIAEIDHFCVELQDMFPAFIGQIDGIAPSIMDGFAQ